MGIFSKGRCEEILEKRTKFIDQFQFSTFKKTIKSLYYKTLVDLGWSNTNETLNYRRGQIFTTCLDHITYLTITQTRMSGVFYTVATRVLERSDFAPQRIPNQLRHVHPEMQHWVPVQGNRLSSDRLDVQPMEGLLLMFPSYLIHDVMKSLQ